MNVAVQTQKLAKIYKLYDKPIDRLKESLNPLKKVYHKEFFALDDINITIDQGECIGLIGRNGSGKSTLLKIITGVLTPSSGTVTVNGKVSALLELGAGFNPEYTGIENIYLNGTMMGYTRQQMTEKLDEILNFADIGDFVNQPVKSYSSGMFVRLAFAVAVNVDPDILIVDEALAVGDVRFQIKCIDKFNEFKKRGKTILFVSHDINSIKKFCTKTIWLNRGKIEAIGDTDYITDEYLDFLKVDANYDKKVKNDTENAVSRESINAIENVDSEKINRNLGKIEKVTIIDEDGKKLDVIEHNKKIIVKVEYEVYDRNLEDIAIGVAIKSIDNMYVCGLNTNLDGFEINWTIGKNIFYLEYENLNLIGGNYYLDVALFEKNAYVPIDYRVKIKTFFVKCTYVGEGLFIFNHKWLNEGKF